jgi:hypothetical protein
MRREEKNSKKKRSSYIPLLITLEARKKERTLLVHKKKPDILWQYLRLRYILSVCPALTILRLIGVVNGIVVKER